jgi:hypothetical protein
VDAGGPPPAGSSYAQPIATPALSDWVMGLLALMLAAGAWVALRKRRA